MRVKCPEGIKEQVNNMLTEIAGLVILSQGDIENLDTDDLDRLEFNCKGVCDEFAKIREEQK